MIDSLFQEWTALTDEYRRRLAAVESRGEDPVLLSGLASQILALERTLTAQYLPSGGEGDGMFGC